MIRFHSSRIAHPFLCASWIEPGRIAGFGKPVNHKDWKNEERKRIGPRGLDCDSTYDVTAVKLVLASVSLSCMLPSVVVIVTEAFSMTL